jgi:hypothetical protein
MHTGIEQARFSCISFVVETSYSDFLLRIITLLCDLEIAIK